MLRTVATPAETTPGVTVFQVDTIRCPVTVLTTPDGAQHLLFQDGARTLQIANTGASILAPVRLLTDAVINPDSVRARLATLACLNDLCTSGRLLAHHFPAAPHGRRLGVVLQALDGWRAGASYRDIAMVLFGRARVDSDWADPGHHLKDQVRRAVHRGRALMNGGYRRFLR